MKYTGKTPEEIVREYRRGLRMKQGLLILVYVVYFVAALWLIWWKKAGSLTVLLSCLLLALCIVLLKIWISWGFLPVNRILNQDCDPVTYTAVCHLLRGVYQRRRNRLNIAVHEVAGIQWCGRFSEALELMDGLAIPEKAVNLQLIARNVRFNCYVKLGDLETARRVREETERYAGTIRKAPLQKQGAQLLNIMDSGLAFYGGDYETARRLEEALSTFYTADVQKVSSAFRLARADLAQGERENARARLEFVLERGGTLYFMEEARQLLAELNGKE